LLYKYSALIDQSEGFIFEMQSLDIVVRVLDKERYSFCMDEKWNRRFENILHLGWLALAGLICAFVAWLVPENLQAPFMVFSLFLILPEFIYVYVIGIWHWKERYRGKHSDLWGALILIETSGWMKIVYLFRHIIPDMRQTGRYRLDPMPLDISPTQVS
jgi:hypothetical protein